MKIVAIVQARMGSTRLPGKALLDLAGEPMLVRVMNRLSRSEMVNDIVVATTNKPADDAIVALCRDRKWLYFRGSEEDVLDRYYRVAKIHQADVIVRITSDCPLIEPEVVDLVVQAFLDRHPGIDYVSNIIPERTFPRGLDTEVIASNALNLAWQEAENLTLREHVTPFIWRNPERFHKYNVLNENNFSHMRWTVDTSEDLKFVREIFGFFKGQDDYSWRKVIALLGRRPELLAINRNVEQKTI
jgi:spore coat polysaccharide biosynthesis protein SpsF